MELVSIIMPAYNAELYIEDSIKSVIKQTYTNWELLIVNDGSIDTTADIAQKYALADNRIKLINQANKRLGAARNTGIRNATGEWIAFLDSDDLWEPVKLERQLQLSKELPDVDVIYTSGWVFNENNLDNLIPYNILSGKYLAEEMYVLEYESNYIPVLSVTVKKTVIDEIGFQEERAIFHGCEDWDYWLRMAIAGANFYGIDEKLFYYRRHSSNMSSNYVSMHLAEMAVFVKNYKKGIFSKKETKHKFIPLANSLIIDLVKLNKKEEAKKMIDSISEILPEFSKLYYVLLKFTNDKTIHVFRLINRVYVKAKRILT